MKSGNAMVLKAEGKPLQLEERRPILPKRSQVLLRNAATSLNFHDFVNVKGGIPGLPCPRVPFSDACAEVLEVGDDVTDLKVGDRVIPNFFTHWMDGEPTDAATRLVPGDQTDGMLQHYVTMDTASLVKAPAGLTDREAATLGCAGVTAWRSVVVEAKIRPGQVVMIQGTGGVSLFALAFAKMAGATVILTSSSDEKLERAHTLGADHLHNYRRDPAWDEFAQKVTDGRGVDLVVDVAGASTLPLSLRAAKINGHVSVIGGRSGGDAPFDFPISYAFSRNLTIKGITVGSCRNLADMCAAIEAHDYKPVIDQVFPLAETEAAIALMDSQAHFGKIVIDLA